MSTNERLFYMVSVERRSIDPNSTFIDYRNAKKILEDKLSQLNLDVECEVYGALGYDDLTIEVKTDNKFKAIMVASGLDSVIDEASVLYAQDYQVKHNASVSGPWKYVIDPDDCADLEQADGWDVIY